LKIDAEDRKTDYRALKVDRPAMYFLEKCLKSIFIISGYEDDRDKANGW